MELRKRKAPPPPPPATGKKPAKMAKTVSKAAEKVKEKVAEVAANVNGSATAKPAVGDTITLDGFGGEIETNEGTKTTLKALVDASKSGVVLFTYPKASTPGCKSYPPFPQNDPPRNLPSPVQAPHHHPTTPSISNRLTI
jgi:peroxiredoxin Q/BCP